MNTKQELLTAYVALVLELLAAPVGSRYGMDETVKAAYRAYVVAGGTSAEALDAIRAARGKE